MSTIEAELCEQHATEAAFLWEMRDRAAEDPLYDLESLGELDERVEAHVDGLRLAGDLGWEICKAGVEDGDAGEVFAASVLAIERWDLKGIAYVLDQAGEDPELARGIEGGLSWAPFDRVRGILPGLLAGRCPPSLQYLGIAACAQHRQDPGPHLGYAILSKDTRLRARGLRAAGELGRADLVGEVQAELRAEEEACRYWASFSAALLGEAQAAQALWALASGGGAFAEQACALAMRRMDPKVGYTWLYSLANAAGGLRPSLFGAAALGDPQIVPWLLECLPYPEAARRAGFALSMITGLDIGAEKLEGEAPEGFASGPSDDPTDEDVEMDPDEGLPWPDAASIRGWWSREGGNFKRGTRYLLGRPLTAEWLEEVLWKGNQAARAAAAVELCLMKKRKVLVEVRAPAMRQGK